MQADKVFEALASGQRRQILAYLSKTELTTSELCQIRVTAPSISRHTIEARVSGDCEA
jgi:DNA-binding transcriptional ArsR family regulator